MGCSESSIKREFHRNKCLHLKKEISNHLTLEAQGTRKRTNLFKVNRREEIITIGADK